MAEIVKQQKKKKRSRNRSYTVSDQLKDLKQLPAPDSPQAEALVQCLMKGSGRTDWKRVVHLLLEYDFSEQLTDCAVKSFLAADKYFRNACDKPSVVNLYVGDNPKSCAIIIAKLCLVKCVDKVLRCGFVSSVDWNTVITEASKKVDSTNFVRYLLPHCDESQLASLLPCLVQQRLWPVVGKALNGCVPEKQCRHAITEAARKAGASDFVEYILPHCSDSLHEIVLPHLVRRHMWQCVHEVLERAINKSQHEWVIEQSAENAQANDIKNYILPLCTDSQLELMLPCLLTRGLWEAVGVVLGKVINETQHTVVVEEAFARANVKSYIDHILPHCNPSQIESFLVNRVSKADWPSVGQVLKKGVQTSHVKSALEAALNSKVKNKVLTSYILPFCSEDLLFCVLKDLMCRNMWEYAAVVFHSHSQMLPEKKQNIIISKTCKQASEDTIHLHILDQCSQIQLESVLPRLVSRGLWKSVGSVFGKGVCERLLKSTLESAFMNYKKDVNRFSKILSPCSSQMLLSVLPLLIKGSLWDFVGKACQALNIDEANGTAIQNACKEHHGSKILSFVLPHCSDSDVESMLPSLLNNHEWAAVVQVLHRGVISTHHQRMDVLLKLAKHADQNTLLDLSDEHLRHVLPHLLLRDFWECASRLIQHEVCDDTQVVMALVEACEKQWGIEKRQKLIFGLYDMPMFRQCSNSQLEIAMPHFVSRGMWGYVGKMLERGVSEPQHRHAVEQAAERADQYYFKQYILPNCSEEHLLSVFLHLVTRGLWQSVSKVLERGVSDEHCRHAVEQAAANASDAEFFELILPRCSDEHLVSAFPHLVSRGLWQSVSDVLERGVSDEHCRHAVKQAAAKASNAEFMKLILPRCSDEHLVSAFPHLVERGLWQSVSKVLERGVRDENCRHAVEQAAAKASNAEFIELILPRCSDEHLGSAFPHLVERGLWQSVSKVLERGVSNEHCIHAVEQAAANASDGDFTVYILPHCNSEHLEPVLLHLVSRGLWKSVGKVLGKYLTEKESRSAFDTTVINAQDRDNIRPYISDDQCCHALHGLTKRTCWFSVCELLKKGECCSETIRKTAVEDICPFESTYDVSNYLLWGSVLEALEICAEEVPERNKERYLESSTHELCSIVPLLMEQEKHFIGRTVRALCKAGNIAVIRSIVEEGFNNWKASEVEEHILDYCNDSQLQIFLPQLVSRDMWKYVDKPLNAFDSDTEQDEQLEHKEAVEKGLEGANNNELVYYILPHCTDSQLNLLLPDYIAKGFWSAVHTALQRNVCIDDQHSLAVREGSLRAKEDDFIHYILPHCTVDDIKSIFDCLVSRGMWETVGKIIGQHDLGNEFQCHIANAIEEASCRASQTDFWFYILPLCKKTQCSAMLTNVLNRGMLQEDQERDCPKEQSNLDLFRSPPYTKMELVSFVFPCLVMFRRWSLLKDYIHRYTKTALDRCLNYPQDFVFSVDANEDSEQWRYDVCVFLLIFKHFRVPASEKLASQLASELTCDTSTNSIFRTFGNEEEASVAQYKTLSVSIMYILCCVVCAGDCKSVGEKGMLCSRIYKAITDTNVFIHRSALEYISHRLSSRHIQTTHVPILILSAVNLLFPEKQHMLVRHVMHEANRSFFKELIVAQFGEHDRRMLFHAAVKQKQWTIVKKWGGHMLYDDQRWWALDEAYKEKQWDVMLHLTEHGLTELELMKVNNRLIRFADWRIQLRMLERGVDIAEIKAFLLKTISKNAQQGTSSSADLEKKLQQIMKLEEKLNSLKFEKYGMSALKSRRWRRVFYFAQRSRAGPSYKLRALKAAIKSKAWHVVIPLIRLGIDTAKHYSLFTGMIKRRQWGVCSALLELGVNVKLCLDALPELMEMNQWTLVARVMEFVVGDSVRQQVMQRALEMREGSVVWRCISTMDHYQLSEDSRVQLFKQAFCRGIWQAVKPLVELKDSIGIQHRDTAMLAAMEQRLWDVVDYCQLYGADIDMKDEARETAVNRAAKKQDWEAVEELLVRGSDPNHLDKNRNSVLRNSIEGKSWSTVKLAIEYHGDIHEQIRRDDYSYNKDYTPLKMLIEKRQGELIDHTLIWCPDQQKAVTDQGETTLHGIADSGCDSSMYYQVARGVNPFTLARQGLSVLAYSVRNKDCPQKKVAECIKAGLGTYQPSLTKLDQDYERLDLESIGRSSQLYCIYYNYGYYYNDFTSPFLMSVVHALMTDSPFTLAHMLYESGSVSTDELFRLYNAIVLYEMKALSGTPLDEDRLPDETNYSYESRRRSMHFISCVEVFLPILIKMMTTPRSLMSLCRLVISHSLSPRHHHHRHIARLNILSPQMKDYVMFTDLADPDYGKDEKRTRFDHIASLKAAIRKMEDEELNGAAGGPANKQGLGKDDEYVPAEPETLRAAEEEEEEEEDKRDDEEEEREEEEEDESEEEEESDE